MRVLAALIMINFSLSFSMNSTFECISLGSNCVVASALEVFQLRNAAYPFDWIVSPFESLCAVLEQDFYDFLNPDYLSVDDNNYGILNKYGFGLMHDFPTVEFVGDFEHVEGPMGHGKLRQDWIKFLPEVEKKYARRIQRLRDVCKGNKKIFFIRYGGINSREEACTLRNILKNSYPNLNFILVIIGNQFSFSEQWGEHAIKNYYFSNQIAGNDVTEWKKIFTDLNIISATSKKFTNINSLQNQFSSSLEKYQTKNFPLELI